MWNLHGKIWYSEEEYNKLKEELNRLKKMNDEASNDRDDEAWEAMNYEL